MTAHRTPPAPPLRVLVAGGGVAAIEAVLGLRALAGDRIRIDLLAPGGDFVERPSSVTFPFSGKAAPRVPLDRLAELGVTLHQGALAAVEVAQHQIRTTDGGRLGYDRLVVATGARPVDGVPGATTFSGPRSAGAVERALRAARERVLFTMPAGGGWTLPLYELALLAAGELPDGPELTIVTAERRPLDVFGPAASDALARLLERAGIGFEGDTVAEAVTGGALGTRDGRLLTADAVIALARLVGPNLAGLPVDGQGFIAVDQHGRVTGAPDVFAAGDVTAGPIKQGGLAAQQADAAAEAIAAEAGAPVTPRRCRRVLRGVVLTGEAPLYLRRDLDDDRPLARTLRGAPEGISRSQLWWPSGKIAGRYLTGFLAADAVPGDTLSDRPRRPVLAHPTRSKD
jgi:sulfide:quinone oxidoreductase